MFSIINRAVGVGFFFLLIFVSGYRLSSSGKPYQLMLFNFHKLIALAAVAFLVVIVLRTQRAGALSQAGLVAAVVTALLFAATIVSGGLVSIEKPMPVVISIIHSYFPFLTALSSAATLYLVLSGR